jgi:hypothetical protein
VEQRRIVNRCRVAIALALVVALLPSVAYSDEPSDPRKEQATQLRNQGNQLFEDGSYPEALDKFQQAYAIFPSPKILLNIGTTQRNLGRNPEAAETYEKYLQAPDRDPARVPEVERTIKEIDAVVGHITVKATVAGSTVTIDGKELGAAPLERTLRVEPGAHKVVAEKAGMQAFVGTLTLKGGETQIAEADPTPPGVVTKTNTVTVESGKGQRIAAIVVGATGLAAGVVGGVFGGIALSQNGDAADHCRADFPEVCDAEGFSLGATASQSATVSTVLLSVGGAALLGGVILWVTAPTKRTIPAAPAPAQAAQASNVRIGLGTTRDATGAEARFRLEW